MSKPENGSDPLPRDVIQALLDALRPITPARAEAIKERLLERIRAEPPLKAAEGITTIRKDDGPWSVSFPGFATKELHDDGKTRTWLARLDPGARIPHHVHSGDEECLVLEGTVFIAGQRMEAGDYQVARTGTVHEEIRSPTGCVLLLRSPSPQRARRN
ncbi:MAG: cupin domain-containing protein [Pseudomonadota bacterium]|nr:cupin domain-containing protein [Pseudomonadota bacterium]